MSPLTRSRAGTSTPSTWIACSGETYRSLDGQFGPRAPGAEADRRDLATLGDKGPGIGTSADPFDRYRIAVDREDLVADRERLHRHVAGGRAHPRATQKAGDLDMGDHFRRRESFHGDRAAVRTRQGDHRVLADLLDGQLAHIRDASEGRQVDAVAAAKILDHVVADIAGKAERIVARAAFELIVAPPADQKIVARAAGQLVITRTTARSGRTGPSSRHTDRPCPRTRCPEGQAA